MITFSILCTLTLLMACKSPESPEDKPDTYYLSGTVTDKNTGLAIEGATVEVHNPSVAKRTTTDQDGRYSIVYKGTGRYVWGTGTKPCMLQVLVVGYRSGFADFASTAGTYTIDFQLEPNTD